jgi:hypothetical protein
VKVVEGRWAALVMVQEMEIIAVLMTLIISVAALVHIASYILADLPASE